MKSSVSTWRSSPERGPAFGLKPVTTSLILMRDLTVLVVPPNRGSFHGGLELYRARPDKGYSLVDCISMQTMRREGLTDVLTNDRHFEQEGFRALFR